MLQVPTTTDTEEYLALAKKNLFAISRPISADPHSSSSRPPMLLQGISEYVTSGEVLLQHLFFLRHARRQIFQFDIPELIQGNRLRAVFLISPDFTFM